jgi:hypothetical protein
MLYIDRHLVLLILLVITGFFQILQTTSLNIDATVFSAKRDRDKLTNDGTLCQHFATKSRSSIRRCILQFPDEPN